MVHRLRVPYPITFLIIGLALAMIPPLSYVQFPPHLILAIFLPILLFHGAATLDLAALRADLMPVVLLVLLGVLVTTGTVGVAVSALMGLSWDVALLCGATVAPCA
jgi:NhaP-type Na+/H+ or K+/H+ antiporter